MQGWGTTFKYFHIKECFKIEISCLKIKTKAAFSQVNLGSLIRFDIKWCFVKVYANEIKNDVLDLY